MKMARKQDAWSEACQAMQVHGDLGPLAKLISGSSPIPPWVREYLGGMLDPSADQTSDRLEFRRSPEAKINQDKLAVAVAVHDRIRAGEPRKKAIGKVGEDFEVSRSYVEDALAHEEKLAENLPPLKYFWDFARSTQATFSAHRTGPRKKRNESTKT
jgi:hypothetical protein